MDEELLGSIIQFAGHRCPENYAFCEGQTLLIKDYQPLYAVIGFLYGGDGINTFKLPDLRPKNPWPSDWGNNPRFMICTRGIFPSFD